MDFMFLNMNIFFYLKKVDNDEKLYYNKNKELKMDIRSKVNEIIMDKLGVEESQITPEASIINDLGADSLDIVELVMAFEQAFNIQIPDEDSEKIQTVGDIYKYLEEKVQS